ncbi:MAG: exopolysaccharide biosynthesis polyprenyl glycosylphosphotransferase [Rhodospirillaceae bacterium]
MIAVLVACDMTVLYLALFLAIQLRMVIGGWFPITISPPVFAGVIMAVLFLPPAYGLVGLYPGYGLTGVERLRKRVVMTCACFGAMILFDYLAQNGQWSRGILLLTAVVSAVAIPVGDALARRFMVDRRWWGEPVVVLGPENQREKLVAALFRQPELGWIPVAETSLAGAGETPPRAELALVALAEGTISAPAWADDLPYQRVVLVPEVTGMPSLWVSVRDLGSHIGLEMRRNLLIPWNQTMKRTFDLALALLAAVPAIPVIVLFALLVAAISPGPVFFGQARAGLEGRPFRMWKLRSMRPNADSQLEDLISASESARESWLHSMKVENDPRIVPLIGNLIRRCSIDELPQLWNVLRGDMSLVGPRPLPPYHLARFDPVTERVRRRVRPGITGLWQVSGRSDVSLTEQQRLDIYYVRNWSLWLDIHILGRTIIAVVTGRGAR